MYGEHRELIQKGRKADNSPTVTDSSAEHFSDGAPAEQQAATTDRNEGTAWLAI